MQLQRVLSGTIEAIGYDNITKIMHVLFKDNTYYKYENIPLNIYQNLMSSPAKGSMLNKISKVYKGIKQ